WLIGAATAAMTAFYMTRLMALTFWGKSRFGSGVHPHESPLSMTLPLLILGLLSLVGGWIGIPHVISKILPGHPMNVFAHWLEPVIAHLPEGHESTVIEWSLMGISVALAGLFAWFAFDSYIFHPERPKALAQRYSNFYALVANKYYVDEAY